MPNQKELKSLLVKTFYSGAKQSADLEEIMVGLTRDLKQMVQISGSQSGSKHKSRVR